jgi:UDP-glucose 4-epimerase
VVKFDSAFGSGSSDCSGGHVVVTGGSGFIGRVVTRGLVDAGCRVTVVDRVPSPLDDVTMIVGDLRDDEVRHQAIADGAASIIHLAAATSVVGSIDDPVGVFYDNVVVTSALLELARNRGVGRFLLASTNAVVGNVGDRLLDEDAPLSPLTPYGATKAAAEMLVSAYRGAYDLAGCSLRFTNVYGSGMAKKDSFVARLMRAARSGSGVQVYGDGHQRRDLVHVADVASAVLLASRRSWKGTFVIGSGHSPTMLELIDAVRRVTGATIPVEHVAPRRGEMAVVKVDIGRARQLGYEPTVGLDDGLEALWHEVVAEWPVETR